MDNQNINKDERFKYSFYVLAVGFFVILAELLYSTFQLFFTTGENTYYMLNMYYNIVEYLFLDITLVVGGAFLFDLAVIDTL